MDDHNLMFSGNYNGGFSLGLAGFGLDNASHFNLAGGSFVGGGSSVPEPSAWAAMLIGFGLAGSIVRRRRPFFANA